MKEPTDEIWEKGLQVKVSSPMSQWQAKLPGRASLVAASHSLVLQEMIREAKPYTMSNRKERLLISGMGSERFVSLFG